MNKLILFAILTFLLPICSQAQDFEGSVTFRMSSNGHSSEMKHFMKGSKMRMEMGAAHGANSIAISDFESKKLFMLMPQTKMYMEVNLNEKNLSSAANKSIENAEIIQTGDTENILGYPCVKWTSKQGNQEMEMWIAKGFGRFYQPESDTQNTALIALRKQLEAEKGFPFRVIQYSPQGKELFRLEVIDVNKMELAEDLFEVPDGYRKIDIKR